MQITVRQAAVFVSGLLLGAVAAVWYVRTAHSPPSVTPPGPQTGIAAAQPTALATRKQAAVAPSGMASAALPHERAACPAQALTASRGAKDGQFVMQPNFDAKTASDIPSFILAGKEAAAAAKLSSAVTAYSIRHSVITDLVTGGLDLLTVAQLSGTSVAMIERHYGHLRADYAAAALARLAL